MRNLICFKLTLLGIAGPIACSLLILPADARRAYDTSGSSSQSSSSNQNSYAINQFSPPGTTTSTNTSSPSQSTAPAANQYSPPQNQYVPPRASYAPRQNQYMSPRNQYTPSQNQYAPSQNQYAPSQNQSAPSQNQYTQPQVTHPYPHQIKSNGTNFYGISPEQMSGGAAVRENTFPANGGGGGYDPRWNPNFGTGAGAQVMAREAGGLAQSLRDNFPLPMSGDEAQMFQVNSFAARSNGGMQSRRP